MKVQDLLQTKENWTQKCFARDIDGLPVHFFAEDASSYCLIGAVLRCYEYPNTLEVFSKLFNAIGSDNLYEWNDSEQRSFEEIRELVEVLDI